MNVRNCRKCRRLFNYVTGPALCNACKKEMEEIFQVVKKYVRENPGSDIRMVAEACDVDPMQIRQWVKEERLCFSDDSPVGIPCERCGRTIKSGRFCDACKVDIKTDLRSVMPKATVAQPVRNTTDHKMRYLEQ